MEVLVGSQNLLARKSNGELLPIRVYKLKIGLKDNKVQKLTSGDKYTVFYPFPIVIKPHTALEHADIEIIVRFSIPWINWTLEKSFRFVTSKRGDGKLYWYRQPLNKEIKFPQK